MVVYLQFVSCGAQFAMMEMKVVSGLIKPGTMNKLEES